MSKLHPNLDFTIQDVHRGTTLRIIFAYDVRKGPTVSLVERIGATPVHKD